MLIRDANCNIVNIKRSDFITDSDYYKQLSFFYGVNLNNINNLYKLNNVAYTKMTNELEYIVIAKTPKTKILECIKNM